MVRACVYMLLRVPPEPMARTRSLCMLPCGVVSAVLSVDSGHAIDGVASVAVIGVWRARGLHGDREPDFGWRRWHAGGHSVVLRWHRHERRADRHTDS